MNKIQFANWVGRCVEDVKQYGIQEKETFSDEVIFSMEEGAERALSPQEKDDVIGLLMDTPDFVKVKEIFEPSSYEPVSYFDRSSL